MADSIDTAGVPTPIPLRVAVTSRDGLAVNERFHRSRDFLVFESSGAGFRFVERRYLPPTAERVTRDFDRIGELLQDCRGIASLEFNGAARTALNGKGFALIEGRGPIASVLREFLSQEPAIREDS